MASFLVLEKGRDEEDGVDEWRWMGGWVDGWMGDGRVLSHFLTND